MSGNVAVWAVAFVMSVFIIAFFKIRKVLYPVRRFPAPPVKSVLITGASSGIGRDAALHLAEAGWEVYAGVRKAADGAAVKKAAEASQAAGKVVPVIIDVGDSESVAKAAKEVTKLVGSAGLGALVNNAGILVAGPLEFLPLDSIRNQLNVNVTGQVDVTQQFLPLLRKAGPGARVVFISSMAGKVSVPFNGIYAASKFALEAIGDALRRELAPWKISVSVVEPGFVQTNILDKSDEQTQPSSSITIPGWKHFYGAYHDNPPRRSSRNVASTAVTNEAIADAITSKAPLIRYVVGAKDFVKTFKVGQWFPDDYIDSTLAKSWPGKNKDKIPQN
jgi:NAD(P)-dependent dehydrogenase (short-subunit alcohol dehydrogenase family)